MVRRGAVLWVATSTLVAEPYGQVCPDYFPVGLYAILFVKGEGKRGEGDDRWRKACPSGPREANMERWSR